MPSRYPLRRRNGLSLTPVEYVTGNPVCIAPPSASWQYHVSVTNGANQMPFYAIRRSLRDSYPGLGFGLFN